MNIKPRFAFSTLFLLAGLSLAAAPGASAGICDFAQNTGKVSRIYPQYRAGGTVRVDLLCEAAHSFR